MNTSRVCKTSLLLTATLGAVFVGGCAVSPDYSHYDWATRGGIVSEQDRSLAGARFELQEGRRVGRVRADEPLTPPGAPTAREQEVIIDPAGPSRPVTTRRQTTVVSR